MNLITNSTFQVNAAGTLFTPAIKYGSGTLTVVATSLGKGLPANYLTILQATDKCGVYFDIAVEPNKQYVFSFYAKSVIGNLGWYAISDLNGSALTEIVAGSHGIDNVLTRYEIPFVTLHTSNTVRIDLYEHITSGYSASICAVQLEEGIKATDFETSESGVTERVAKGTVAITAYTQTYSTASKTVPAATASTPPAGGAGATEGAYDTAANRDLMIASLTANIADVLALKKVVNAIIDDLQALGLVI